MWDETVVGCPWSLFDGQGSKECSQWFLSLHSVASAAASGPEKPLLAGCELEVLNQTLFHRFFLVWVLVKSPFLSCTLHAWLWMLSDAMSCEQGHPTTVFCKNMFGEAKLILPRSFFCSRIAKNFYINVPFTYNFRNLSNKFPTIFWSIIFHILLSRLQYFS